MNSSTQKQPEDPSANASIEIVAPKTPTTALNDPNVRALVVSEPEVSTSQGNNLPTKSMMQLAIEALTTMSRKGFSLAKLRKYIFQNYLGSTASAKRRYPLLKKFLKSALETGDLVSVKGSGLTGSFRVPSKSSLHKNQNNKTANQKKLTARKISEKTLKGDKKQNGSVTELKKVKSISRKFSANI